MELQERQVIPLSPHPSAAHSARTAVAEQFELLGHPTAIPAAQLAVTELVNNVTVHTDCRSCRAIISASEERIRVAVLDCEPDVVAHRRPGEIGSLQPGMGLLIVESLTDRWGCDSDLFTKTVWFEFERPAD